MKITQKILSEKAVELNNDKNALKIIIECDSFIKDLEMIFIEDEPEDASLSRDFNDCYTIIEALKIAFESGKNGEKLEVEIIEVDDPDEL